VLTCLAALLVAPVSDVVLAALHRLAPSRPTLLPKMDFSGGLPEEAQTMVVVPAILSSEPVVRELLENIEAHYLSNQDDRLYFALLSDWRDAAQESLPDDAALLQAARDGVRELNERHGDGTRERFYLFHRRRGWNPGQGSWLGWERKRGKLHEFNRLLRGASDTSYVGVTADGDLLARTRYVITLDADTLLPRDAARRLVGTISHPLNRPQLDARSGRVVRGYGIIQPHVAMPPPGAERSAVPGLLVNRFNANTYSVVPSNAYQDLFGETSYVGKGLYDVDVFEAALKDRAPENALLSHDMFEGLYARPALAADIRVFDSPQSHYEAVARRQHRWTRGDWQLWPWLFPRVPAAHGAAARNVLPFIARWKILDNLRRSLVQPALLLWLVAAWTVLPGSPAAWTLLALLTLLAKLAIPLTHDLPFTLRQAAQAGPSKRVRAVCRLVAKKGGALLLQLASALAYLAHQSYLTLDAVVRTLYRTTVSGKRLLEWLTAAQAQSASSVSLRSSFRYMWQAPLTAAGCGLLVLLVRPGALPVAVPFLLAWVVSPAVVHLLNRRIQARARDLERVVERALRLSGHRMWQTLETFLGVEYDPHAPAGARNRAGYVNPLRASHVNLARLLLWTKANYELGGAGATELAGRLELTLSEISKLRLAADACRPARAPVSPGALAPAFILQAENGNLAGHLGTLGRFCAGVAGQPLLGERVLKGLADTVLLMMDGLTRVVASAPEGGGGDALKHLREELEMCARYLSGGRPEDVPQTFTAWRRVFDTLAQRAAVVRVELEVLSHDHSATKVGEVRHWANSLALQVSRLRADLQLFAPWLSLRTRHLASLIRRHDARAYARWNRIMEMLDRPAAVSLLPRTLDAALDELALLSDGLDKLLPPDTPDRKTVLDGCEQLRGAVEASARASVELSSRYARLAGRLSAVAGAADFAPLFDEERRLLKHRFPDKVA
jgi:cyclic beta-1,2-glucan synthetase